MTTKSNVIVAFRRPKSDVEALSDEALIAGCATGDPNALAQLFDRMSDHVARFLGRLVYVDGQDVEDLVHDVFLAVFKNAPSYERKAGVKTWVLAIAGNIARERCRKSVRGSSAKKRLIEEQDVEDPRALERSVIAREVLTKVRREIATLPHEQRVAFVMCDVEGLPGVEVARALGIPTGTLYRRLHEARKRLRHAVEGGTP